MNQCVNSPHTKGTVAVAVTGCLGVGEYSENVIWGDMNIWIRALLSSVEMGFGPGQRWVLLVRGHALLIWSCICHVHSFLPATEISQLPSPSTQPFSFLKITCLKGTVFPVDVDVWSHECDMHSLLLVLYFLLAALTSANSVWRVSVSLWADTDLGLLPCSWADGADPVYECVKQWKTPLTSQMCPQGQIQGLQAASREIMEITTEAKDVIIDTWLSQCALYVCKSQKDIVKEAAVISSDGTVKWLGKCDTVDNKGTEIEVGSSESQSDSQSSLLLLPCCHQSFPPSLPFLCCLSAVLYHLPILVHQSTYQSALIGVCSQVSLGKI